MTGNALCPTDLTSRSTQRAELTRGAPSEARVAPRLKQPRHLIDEAELAGIRDQFPNLWKDPNGDPRGVYIGCPHNSYEEMAYWCERLQEALNEAGQKKLAVPVVLASSVAVKDHLFDEYPLLYRDMVQAGVEFTGICTPVYLGLKGMADIERGVTNAGKARCYTNLRLYDDDHMVQIALTGKAPD